MPRMTRARSCALLAACLLPPLASGCAKSTPATTPPLGRITVGVTTTGPDLDEIETMVFMVDIQPRGTFERVGANGGVYDEDVPAGEYVIRLARLPARCRVNGVSERRVRVSERRTTAIRFAVTCR